LVANTTLACTPNAGISKFTVQAGKKYLLRLINTSAEGMQKFTIDGHNFTVIANDFVPINPYSTNVITLGVGQRSDVIVCFHLVLVRKSGLALTFLGRNCRPTW
jgi:FtsP/CotA-like multicopper oxidase with cupredoxin domain